MSTPIPYRGKHIRIHMYFNGRRNRDMYESYITIPQGGWQLAQTELLTENGALIAAQRAIDRVLLGDVDKTF